MSEKRGVATPFPDLEPPMARPKLNIRKLKRQPLRTKVFKCSVPTSRQYSSRAYIKIMLTK